MPRLKQSVVVSALITILLSACGGAPPVEPTTPTPALDTEPAPPAAPVSATFCNEEYPFDVTVIICNDENLSDLGPIVDFTRLERLVLNRTSVNDFSLLSRLPALTSLVISGAAVTEVDEIAALTGLRSLSLVYSDITDISFVSNMTSLEELLLHNTAVSNLQPVSGLRKLRILSVGPGVTTVAPLLGLTGLEELVLVETKIPKNQLNRLKKAIPNLKIID
jgi:internalin A